MPEGTDIKQLLEVRLIFRIPDEVFGPLNLSIRKDTPAILAVDIHQLVHGEEIFRASIALIHGALKGFSVFQPYLRTTFPREVSLWVLGMIEDFALLPPLDYLGVLHRLLCTGLHPALSVDYLVSEDILNIEANIPALFGSGRSITPPQLIEIHHHFLDVLMFHLVIPHEINEHIHKIVVGEAKTPLLDPGAIGIEGRLP